MIRLLIKGVKRTASEEGEIGEIETGYAVRGEDESTEAFTARLLKLAEG